MADWSRHFDEPIALPDGGELRTLLDAGRYVDKLPRSMYEREEVAVTANAYRNPRRKAVVAEGRPTAALPSRRSHFQYNRDRYRRSRQERN